MEDRGHDAQDGERDEKRGHRLFGRRRESESDDHFSPSALEWVLRGALVYVVIGFVYIGTHIELLDQLENQLSAPFTVFADYAALAVMMTGWPLLLGSAWVCGVAGCGVI